MDAAEVPAALAAMKEAAAASDLHVAEYSILQKSNRLVVLGQPCDAVFRIAPMSEERASRREVAVVADLAASGAPVAGPEPRIDKNPLVVDEFVVSIWAYFEPTGERTIMPAHFAEMLFELHTHLRAVRADAPHFTERVSLAQGLIRSPELVPEVQEADRELLVRTLNQTKYEISQSGAREQLLHGEPHSDNVLRTSHGLRFTDFEAICYGPVEFDLADVPTEVADYYPADAALLRSCRGLVLAMVATWCFAGAREHVSLRDAASGLIAELREIASA